MCNLCGEDCESVDHFLWNGPAYLLHHELFLEHLKMILGKQFSCFKSCDVQKSCFVLETEQRRSCHEELLCLVKSYIIDVREVCESKLYDYHWSAAELKLTTEVLYLRTVLNAQ